MADAVVSQAGAEAITAAAAFAEASQAGAEAITAAAARAVVSQLGIETIAVAISNQPTLIWGLQLELDGEGNGWTDVSADVRAAERAPGIVLEYGISGSDPDDRVASAGSLRWNFDNSTLNTDGTLGYYSPFHASRRPGFDFNIGVRWWLWYGTTRIYKHRGKLSDILPTPGAYGPRLTACQSLDWMDDAARVTVPDLAAQTGKRADELADLILNAMDTPPAARYFDVGVGAFPYALDGGTGQQQTVREELNKIALSEQGYFYIRGDASSGGTLAFEARGHRTLDPTTLLSFDNDMHRDGLVSIGGRDDVYRTVQVVVHPTTVDPAATTVLFALNTASTYVAAGATLDTIFGPYRNPDTNEDCGGVDMVAPVATTDYTMNTQADGGGSDVTGDFTVSASYTGQGVRYTIVNGGASGGYVTKLQARGKGVYRSDAVVEKTVTGSYGDRVLRLELPYQTSITAADRIATYLAGLLASPVARVKSVKFCASKSASFLTAAIAREPGDRIAITETVLGLNGALFTIQRVKLELQSPDILWCTWELAPWGLDAWWTPSTFTATGGTITEANGYTIHTFTSNGTFTITSGDTDTTVEYFIVAGGGGGGASGFVGGGGGGGVRTGSISAVLGTGYSVVVGAGGAAGANGSNSSVFGVTSTGGGKGGAEEVAGSSGGSGGGGGTDTNVGSGGDHGTTGDWQSHAGGSGTSGQGYAGGRSHINAAGGGGGAGGDGADAAQNNGGSGGAGLVSSFSGASATYASGGYGTGITSNGSSTSSAYGKGGNAGSAGGAGVVIIRYPTPE